MQTMTHTISTPAVAATESAQKALRLVNEATVAVFRSLLIWQARYAERQRMANLSARELRDMGLTREQVTEALVKSTWTA